MPISTYYHSKYVQACKKAIELLDIEGRYSDIVNICKNAVLIDPYDEGLHMSLIKALADNKQEQAAIMHYEHVIKMFYNEFGINPSEQFTAMYKDILKSTNGVEFDLSVVKERLNEKEAAKGAFYCKFEIFKEIYQLEARAQERTGRVVNICLLSVTDSEGERPEKKKLDTAMQKLHDLIKEQLRRGDVFARFSVSQYLIMLPDTTVENAEKVVLRIVKQYKRDNPRSPVELHYCLQLLGSVS